MSDIQGNTIAKVVGVGGAGINAVNAFQNNLNQNQNTKPEK